MKEKNTSIEISIITPCGKNSSNLNYFLQSLQYQDLDPNYFELILAVEELTQIQSLAERYTFRFNCRIILHNVDPAFKGHTAGILRNAAAAEAVGKTLIFIDSDCILHPSCLSNYSQIISSKINKVMFYGLTYELPAYNWGLLSLYHFESFEDLERASIKDHRELNIENPLLLTADTPWRKFYTNNAAVERNLFFEAGGFDENGYRCHDMDLAYRLHKLNAKCIAVPAAKAIHIEHPRSVFSIIDQRDGWINLMTKHPELSFYLHDQIILNQRHFSRTIQDCEDSFIRIIKSKNGLRIGKTKLLPVGTNSDIILEELSYIPYVIVQKRQFKQIFLRLDRFCWDYSFIIPDFSTVIPPEISIIIPTYNAEETVERCLSSVFLSTIQNFEIIVIDDGSLDKTIREVQKFAFDSRLRIISFDQNRGLSFILNKGMELAEAEYILQVDADDFIEPDALEKILDFLENNSDASALYSDPIIHRGSKITYPKGIQVRDRLGFLNYNIPQVTRTYKKRSLIEAGGWSLSDGYNGRYYEDRLMLYKMAEIGKVIYLPEHMYHVVTREESLSNKNALEAASAKLSIMYGLMQHNKVSFNFIFENQYLSINYQERSIDNIESGISVIIPFAGFQELLRFSIKSWLESDLIKHHHEIIIVDDNSEENIDEFKLVDPCINIIHLQERKGPGFARNVGASGANYPYLFFSDADHIVSPNIISAHLSKHKQLEPNQGAVVGCVFGRRSFTWFHPEIPYRRKKKLLEIYKYQQDFENIAALVMSEEPFYLIDSEMNQIWQHASKYTYSDEWLANWGKIIIIHGENLDSYSYKWTRLSSGSVSIRKSTFESIKGFDPSLQSMEDWEFGIRLQKGNFFIACAPEAEPLHQVHPIDENRLNFDQNSFNYLISSHKEYIEDLLDNRQNDILPPAYDLFKAIQQNFVKSTFNSIKPIGVRKNNDYKKVCITFDDGPNPYGTHAILDLLDQYNCKATFFILGERAEVHPDLIKEISAKGHLIGLHAWVHSDFTNLTSVEVIDDLNRTHSLIKKIIKKSVKFARPPYGRISPSYYTACQALGLEIVSYNRSVGDWEYSSPREMIGHLALNGISNNILLFHDANGNPDNTVHVLSWVLQYCIENKIQMVKADTFSRNIGLPKIDLSYVTI
jgi:peptidoglycan/xylan/chitin deacetylase (PgdA/CDA1 family)/glycosyltransferase involved in cell wall biosynthesis